MEFTSDYPGRATVLLYENWTYAFEKLLACKTAEEYESWYIDERSDPITFLSLLCLANPGLYEKVTGRKPCKTKIIKAIEYIFEDFKKNHPPKRRARVNWKEPQFLN